MSLARRLHLVGRDEVGTPAPEDIPTLPVAFMFGAAALALILAMFVGFLAVLLMMIEKCG